MTIMRLFTTGSLVPLPDGLRMTGPALQDLAASLDCSSASREFRSKTAWKRTAEDAFISPAPFAGVVPSGRPVARMGAMRLTERPVQLAFADYVLDPERRELTRSSQAVAIGPQV